jgi:ribonucleotide reductase alpha subunit
MAAERGAFIDQSQSLNIHMDQPNFGKLTSLHFYTWSKVQPFDIITYNILLIYIFQDCN